MLMLKRILSCPGLLPDGMVSSPPVTLDVPFVLKNVWLWPLLGDQLLPPAEGTALPAPSADPAALRRGIVPSGSTAGAALGRRGDEALSPSGAPRSGWFVMRTPLLSWLQACLPGVSADVYGLDQVTWAVCCLLSSSNEAFIPAWRCPLALFWKNSLPRGSSINLFSERASSGWSHQFCRQP